MLGKIPLVTQMIHNGVPTEAAGGRKELNVEGPCDPVALWERDEGMSHRPSTGYSQHAPTPQSPNAKLDTLGTSEAAVVFVVVKDRLPGTVTEGH